MRGRGRPQRPPHPSGSAPRVLLLLAPVVCIGVVVLLGSSMLPGPQDRRPGTPSAEQKQARTLFRPDRVASFHRDLIAAANGAQDTQQPPAAAEAGACEHLNGQFVAPEPAVEPQQQQQQQQQQPHPPRRAFATVVCSDEELISAVGLVESLRAVHPDHTVVMLVADTLSERLLQVVADNPVLSSTVDVRFVVPPPNPSLFGDRGGVDGAPQPAAALRCDFSKLYVLDLVEFDKVVLLAPHAVVLRPVAELFERPMWTAAPANVPPDTFGDGTVVVNPNDAVARRMWAAAAVTPSPDASFQGFLNAALPGWFQCPSVYRLPFVYGTVLRAKRFYTAAWLLVKSRGVRVLHCDPQPWTAAGSDKLYMEEAAAWASWVRRAVKRLGVEDHPVVSLHLLSMGVKGLVALG